MRVCACACSVTSWSVPEIHAPSSGPSGRHFALRIDMAHRSVRQHDAILDPEAVLAAHPFAHLVAHAIAVGRVHGGEEAIPASDLARVDAEDAERLARPLQLAGVRVPLPASEPRDALRARQRALALRQLDERARAAQQIADAVRQQRGVQRLRDEVGGAGDDRRGRATPGSPSAVTTRIGVGSLGWRSRIARQTEKPSGSGMCRSSTTRLGRSRS